MSDTVNCITLYKNVGTTAFISFSQKPREVSTAGHILYFPHEELSSEKVHSTQPLPNLSFRSKFQCSIIL